MYYCYLYCVQKYFEKGFFPGGFFYHVKYVFETCLEPVKNEFCFPPMMTMFPRRVC